MPSFTRMKELERAATPGPWMTASNPNLLLSEDGDVIWPDHLGERLPSMWDYYLNETDAEMIVALRNGFPHLLTVIEAARRLVTAWDTGTVQRARTELNTAIQRLEDV